MEKICERPVHTTGSCLCGSVSYTVRGALRGIWACHCMICRRIHGHVCAYAACDSADLEIARTTRLRWYRASPLARRGFCSRCSTHLFSVREGHDYTSITASSINEPTGLRLLKHLCVNQKGDYYEISDGLPQEGGRSIAC